MSGAREALAFLTPFGGPRSPGPTATRWFSVVGALIGLALGVVWWACDRVWPPLLAAAVVVVADLAVTGMLHVDGLADTADGLLPHLSRERRLEVMTAPDVGAFGVTVVAAALLLRWAALAALSPAPLLLAGLWCASRSLMAGTVAVVPYARAAGLATAFRPGADRRGVLPAALGAAGGVALALAWRRPEGAVVVVLGVLAGAAVIAWARRGLGGFTGDVLGAAGVVAETTGLVVAAARW